MARLLLVAAGAVMVLWALYGFRFHASPDGGDPFNRPFAEKIDDLVSEQWRQRLNLLDRLHVLPRAYIWGLADTVHAGLEGRGSSYVLFGKRGLGQPPFWAYPLYLLVKVPLGSLLLVLAGIFCVARRGRRFRPQTQATLAFLTAVAIVYLVVLATSRTCYAGVRHALPVVPCLAVLAGIAVSEMWRTRNWALTAVVATGFLGSIALSISEPRVWEYHNEIAGGTAAAWRHFGYNEGLNLGQRSKEIAAYVRSRLTPSMDIPYVWYFTVEEEMIARGVLGQEWRAAFGDGHEDAVYDGTFIVGPDSCVPQPPDWEILPLCASPPSDRMGNALVFRGRFHLPKARAYAFLAAALEKVYTDTPQPELAERMIAESLRLNPKLIAAAVELANLLNARGEQGRAAETLRSVLPTLHATDPVRALLEERARRLAANEAVSWMRNPFVE